MSMRKMLQLAMSLTLLIALLGGGMGAWAAASNQEPTPEGRDWEPTPWPYPPQGPTWTPPPSETPYDGQVYVYVPEPTPEERDFVPAPWSTPIGPTLPPPPYRDRAPQEPAPEERDFVPTPFPIPTPLAPDEPTAPAGVRTQEVSELLAGDEVKIAALAISSGAQPPYRTGLDAHGRAWTQAGYEPGVITWVLVDLRLWWWDGSRWINMRRGFDFESELYERGLITASGLAIDFNVPTGWYAVTSLHRVYVNGVRVYYSRRESQHVWLTFP